jgi:predicted PurR-regulated permease PerM
VDRLTRWGIAAWSLIGLAVVAYLAVRFVLYPVRIIFPPLAIAVLIVYALNPLVSWLERRGFRRGWAALLIYVLLLGLLGLPVRFLIPVLSDQVSSFAANVPDLTDRLQAGLSDLGDRLGVNIDPKSLVGDLGPSGSGGEFIRRIFSLTSGVLHAVVIVVAGLVLGFYLLVDLPKVVRGASALIPARRRDEVSDLALRVQGVVGAYFRGQLLVAAFVGAASMLVLWFVGLPYWGLVGAIAGLFNLIPLIGPFIGGAVAFLIAFTTSNTGGGVLALDPGLPMALGSAVALTIVQQIDNHVISPNVMARTVKLHPLTVLLALLVAGELFGLWGMLVAVPAYATTKIVILHVWDTKSRWPPPEDATVSSSSRGRL